jgi:pimeloyl-ACP methyl ester carboxylesterase
MKKSIPLLYTDVKGSGPTVVLLHGIFSSSKYWSKVSELLEKDYKVIAIDLLGFGQSPKPRHGKYDYQDHIENINKALDARGVNEPFILIGHSMGALIALRYSIIHEDRVRKLVLTNMPVMLGAAEVRREILGTNRFHRLGLSRGINRVTWATFRGMHRLRLLPKNTRARLKGNDFFFHHTAVSRMRSFYNIIAGAQVDIDLAKLSIPASILSGLEDRKVYLENFADKIRFGPNVALAHIQTGHHIPCQFPELVVDQVRNPIR